MSAVGATLYHPRSVALDGNQVLRSIATIGEIHLHSGKPNQFTTGSPSTKIVGPLGQVLYNNPTGITLRTDGTTYVVDDLNARTINTKNTVAVFGLVTLADPDTNGLWRVNLSTRNSEGRRLRQFRQSLDRRLGAPSPTDVQFQ